MKRVREGEEIQDTQTESRKTVTVLGSRAKKYETSIDKLIPKKQKTKTVNLSARRAEREREKLDGGGNTKAKNDRREGWWNNEYLIKYCKVVISLV